MAYFVRVSVSYDTIKGFFETVPADTLVVYEHDASRIHCHFYIITSLKTDSLKVRLKKYYPFTKTDWSFKTARDEMCIRYMAKGKYDPKYVRGYDQQKLDDYKADWTPEPPPKETKTGPSQFSMAREVKDMTEERDDIVMLYHDLVKNTIYIHQKYEKAFSEFNIEKVAITALAFFTGGRTTLTQRIVGKFSRYGT